MIHGCLAVPFGSLDPILTLLSGTHRLMQSNYSRNSLKISQHSRGINVAEIAGWRYCPREAHHTPLFLSCRCQTCTIANISRVKTSSRAVKASTSATKTITMDPHGQFSQWQRVIAFMRASLQYRIDRPCSRSSATMVKDRPAFESGYGNVKILLSLTGLPNFFSQLCIYLSLACCLLS